MSPDGSENPEIPGDPERSKAQVEETIAFLERDLEHAREELTEVWRRLEALERRVDRISRDLEGPAGESVGGLPVDSPEDP